MAALNMNIDPHIFRAYDIRGDVRTQLTADVVKVIGQALALSHFTPPVTLAVGRDARTHSPELHQALTEGLKIRGIDIVDLGQITTPMLYYVLFKYSHAGGVMITGSHNPVFDNGLKICRGTESFVRKDIESVQHYAWSLSNHEPLENQCKPGQIHALDIAPEYEHEILS